MAAETLSGAGGGGEEVVKEGFGKGGNRGRSGEHEVDELGLGVEAELATLPERKRREAGRESERESESERE